MPSFLATVAKTAMVMQQHHESRLGDGFSHWFGAVIFGATISMSHRDRWEASALVLWHEHPGRELNPAFGREADLFFDEYDEISFY